MKQIKAHGYSSRAMERHAVVSKYGPTKALQVRCDSNWMF